MEQTTGSICANHRLERSLAMNTLTIVIVSWNSKGFLLDCLRSLAAQEEFISGSYHIVVVDNASDDGTAEAVYAFDPTITVIRNTTNIGFAAGNNLGISSTDSQYIALINPDVIVSANCVALLCRYLNEHPNVGLIGPKVFNPDGTIQHSYWAMPTLKDRLRRAFGMRSREFAGVPSRNGACPDRVKPVGVLSGCFWMVRRSALNDVGLLDEDFFMYAEDTDWCKRFWKAQWKVVYVPEATAIHYGGGSSAKVPVRSYIEMHRANLQYWRKHHGSLGQVSVRAIMLLHQVLRIVGGGLLFFTFRSKRESIRPIIRRSVACLYYLCGRVRPNVI